MVRRIAHLCLTVWVCACSTLCTVTHCHAGGGSPHTHGLGFAAGPAPAPGGPVAAHRHLVLLGVEAGAVDCAPLAGQGRPDDGITVGFAGVVPATPADPAPLPDAAFLPPPRAAGPPAAFAPRRPAAVPVRPAALLCAKADRARTGVLLV